MKGGVSTCSFPFFAPIFSCPLCVVRASRSLGSALPNAPWDDEAQMLHLILAVAARDVAVPVISNSVFQISTSRCPATRIQRLSRVFQSSCVRNVRRRPGSAKEQVVRIGRWIPRRKAAVMLGREVLTSSGHTGHDVALHIGGPTSGCNSCSQVCHWA